MAQMKSSEKGTPVDMAYTFPAMSEEMHEMMTRVREIPAFFLIVYLDEVKQLQWWGGLNTEFPKERLKEGLALLEASGMSEKVAINQGLTLPPKMDTDMFALLCKIRLRPAYFGIIYIEEGELKTWAEMREGFPEDQIAVGIARAEQRFITNLIDHIKPVSENPQLEKLRAIGRKSNE